MKKLLSMISPPIPTPDLVYEHPSFKTVHPRPQQPTPPPTRRKHKYWPMRSVHTTPITHPRQLAPYETDWAGMARASQRPMPPSERWNSEDIAPEQSSSWNLAPVPVSEHTTTKSSYSTPNPSASPPSSPENWYRSCPPTPMSTFERITSMGHITPRHPTSLRNHEPFGIMRRRTPRPTPSTIPADERIRNRNSNNVYASPSLTPPNDALKYVSVNGRTNATQGSSRQDIPRAMPTPMASLERIDSGEALNIRPLSIPPKRDFEDGRAKDRRTPRRGTSAQSESMPPEERNDSMDDTISYPAPSPRPSFEPLDSIGRPKPRRGRPKQAQQLPRLSHQERINSMHGSILCASPLPPPTPKASHIPPLSPQTPIERSLDILDSAFYANPLPSSEFLPTNTSSPNTPPAYSRIKDHDTPSRIQLPPPTPTERSLDVLDSAFLAALPPALEPEPEIHTPRPRTSIPTPPSTSVLSANDTPKSLPSRSRNKDRFKHCNTSRSQGRETHSVPLPRSPVLEVYDRMSTYGKTIVCEARAQHCSSQVHWFAGRSTNFVSKEQLKATLVEIVGDLGDSVNASDTLKAVASSMIQSIIAWDLDRAKTLEQEDVPILSTVPMAESINEVDALCIAQIFVAGMKKFPQSDSRSKFAELPIKDLFMLLHFTLLVARPVLAWELDFDEI